MFWTKRINPNLLIVLMSTILLLATACRSGESFSFIVTITSPEQSTHQTHSQTASASTPIQFEGYARDSNNVELSGSQLVWT